MLFGSFLPEVCPNPERVALLETMLADFRASFPSLHFELRLDRRVVNAQSILLGGRRCVLIYGGLALHPKLAEDSLTFIFLHEAGHHLAPGARLPFNPSLACECVADDWAAGEGAEILHQGSGRRLRLAQAVNELECFMHAGSESDATYPEDGSSRCLNRKWAQRRSALENSRGKFSNLQNCTF